MAFRPPSLRAIASFEAASRLGSFAKTAEELNLTQSAVSHAIRTLEDRLGAKLFIRKGGSLEITAEGVALAGRVRRSLALLDEAFDVKPWSARTRLEVSALYSFAEAELAQRLPHFLAAHPDVELSLVGTSRLVDLAAGEADVGIRFGTGQWPGLSAVLIARERLYPVVSPAYRDGDLPRQPSDLAGCDIIAHADVPWTLWLDAAGCREPIFNSQLVVDSVPLALAAAMGGGGVALARDRIARHHIAAGRLVRLFDVEIEDEYSYWAAWPNSSPKIELIRSFVAWLEREFAPIP